MQLKHLARTCCFRLRNQSLPNASGLMSIDKKGEENEKDKPKKKVLATTLPPKTGAIYKEAYKEKLRKKEEEQTESQAQALKKVDPKNERPAFGAPPRPLLAAHGSLP